MARLMKEEKRTFNVNQSISLSLYIFSQLLFRNLVIKSENFADLLLFYKNPLIYKYFNRFNDRNCILVEYYRVVMSKTFIGNAL